MEPENPKLPEPADYPPATFFEALRRHMATHAGLYGITILLGLQAFCTGFYDNFWIIEPPEMQKLGWWQVAAAVGKSLSFALGIAVGYVLKPNSPTK